jgi:hypothetical protein
MPAEYRKGFTRMTPDSYEVLSTLGGGVKKVKVNGETMFSVSLGSEIISMGKQPNMGGNAPADEPAIHNMHGLGGRKGGLEE